MGNWDRVDRQPPAVSLFKIMTSTTILGTPCSLLAVQTGKKFWFADTDIEYDIVVQTIAGGNMFDSHVVDLLEDYIKPDSVVLDVGSNYGQMAMAFAELAPQGTVHAFEVNPLIYECMNRTFAENGFTNIVSHSDAVWHVAGETLMLPPGHHQPIPRTAASWGVVVVDNNLGIDPELVPIKVQSMTIDDLNLERVDVMKFDIQGSDLHGMMGAIETIKRCKPFIIFEFDSYFTKIYPDQILDAYFVFTESIGYKVIADVQSNYLIGPA
jgi:FkbM family methyltransferase